MSIERAVGKALERTTRSRAYPLVVGAVGFVFTLSMTFPVTSALLFAVLLRRERWRSITASAALGASAGGLLLYLIFHHLGWSQIVERYPDLTASSSWRDATAWVSEYGAWALVFVAATPLPQTPALAFAAIIRLPILEVLAALLVGKLLKYGVYAWFALRFPRRLARYGHLNPFFAMKDPT